MNRQIRYFKTTTFRLEFDSSLLAEKLDSDYEVGAVVQLEVTGHHGPAYDTPLGPSPFGWSIEDTAILSITDEFGKDWTERLKKNPAFIAEVDRAVEIQNDKIINELD